jgi:glutamate synthase (NADPH/NADH)
MGRVSFADDVTERTLDEYEEIEEEQVNIYPYENTPDNKSWAGALPKKQGLYDPELEKDACGVGFAANIKGVASHKIVTDGMLSINPGNISHAKGF